jgi:large subunit ribosomal protein L23
MKINPYQILRRPIITEKSVDIKARSQTLCFQVDPRATKVEIKEAVEDVYKELQGKIASVHTARFRGKVRRRGTRFGEKPDWKKAYVKVKPGARLPEYVEASR